MTKKQAFDIILKVTENIPLVRREHNALSEALNILNKLVEENCNDSTD